MFSTQLSTYWNHLSCLRHLNRPGIYDTESMGNPYPSGAPFGFQAMYITALQMTRFLFVDYYVKQLVIY